MHASISGIYHFERGGPIGRLYTRSGGRLSEHNMVFLRCCLLIILLTVTTGCSWITRDYTFSPDKNSGWTSHFIKASQPSVKDVPVPDLQVSTFRTGSVTLNVWSGYTLVLTGGIWPLPVIPVSYLEDETVALNLRIQATTTAIEIDPAQIKTITDDGVRLRYTAVCRTYEYANAPCASDSVAGKIYVNPGNTVTLRLETSQRAKDINHLSVIIEGIRVANDEVEIPPLELVKKPGSFNYDEVTI